MATSALDIIIRAQNQTGGAIRSVTQELSGLDRAAATLSSGLGGLLAVGGVAGLGALAAGAGRAALDLGHLGQEIEKNRGYFEAFSGGAGQAAVNLEAMRRATRGAVTDQQAMQAATKYLGMGLATNTQELEQLSRMAVMLGGNTRTASEALDEFALLLANKSILRLDTFNISGMKVRSTMEQMQAANKGLSSDQAFLNAVLEVGTEQMDKLAKAGVDATTAAQDLAVAWQNLQSVMGQKTEPAVSWIEGLLAEAANQASYIMSGARGIEEAYESAFLKYRDTAIIAARAQEEYNQAVASGNPILIEGAQRGLELARANESEALAAYEAAQAVAEHALASGTAAEAAGKYASSLGPVIGGLWDVVAAAQAAAQAQWDAMQPERRTEGLQEARFGTMYRAANQPTPIPGSARYILLQELDEKRRAAEALARQQEQDAKAAGRAWSSAMKDAARDTERAFQDKSNSIASMLQGAISSSLSLGSVLPGGGDLMQPGANGPFEKLFQIQDIAINAQNPGKDTKRFMDMLGLNQDQAKGIMADFQRGIFSDQVKQYVDKDALIDQLNLQELASATQTAFADELAKASGEKPEIISAMLGINRTANGAVAAPDLTGVVPSVVSEFDAEIKANNLQLEALGGQTWGAIGKGIVDKAKADNTLYRAVEAMVHSVLTGALPK